MVDRLCAKIRLVDASCHQVAGGMCACARFQLLAGPKHRGRGSNDASSHGPMPPAALGGRGDGHGLNVLISSPTEPSSPWCQRWAWSLTHAVRSGPFMSSSTRRSRWPAPRMVVVCHQRALEG